MSFTYETVSHKGIKTLLKSITDIKKCCFITSALYHMCFIQYCSTYYLSLFLQKLNSSSFQKYNNTMASEEDLTYLAGVKVSYQTYKKWSNKHGTEPNLPGIQLHPEQLFWVYFARPFCAKYNSYLDSPEKLRVNGIVSSLEEFVNDYKCDSSDVMNFEEKCDLFWLLC